jgi:adenine-specific DNA-methyltransferase
LRGRSLGRIHHLELKSRERMARATRTQARPRGAGPQRYEHSQDAAARPEIGVAPRFRAKAPPATYRYDSSLAPALGWDTNPGRETAAFLLACIEDAAALPTPDDFPEPRELQGADGAVPQAADHA